MDRAWILSKNELLLLVACLPLQVKVALLLYALVQLVVLLFTCFVAHCCRLKTVQNLLERLEIIERIDSCAFASIVIESQSTRSLTSRPSGVIRGGCSVRDPVWFSLRTAMVRIVQSQ